MAQGGGHLLPGVQRMGQREREREGHFDAVGGQVDVVVSSNVRWPVVVLRVCVCAMFVS